MYMDYNISTFIRLISIWYPKPVVIVPANENLHFMSSCAAYSEYGSDSMVMPIIRHHETLSITQQDLCQRLSSLTEELDQGRCNLDSLKLQHSTSRHVCVCLCVACTFQKCHNCNLC